METEIGSDAEVPASAATAGTIGADFRAALRKVGAGSNRSKSLTLDEARCAATTILEGKATSAQVGALLIAMRLKEEVPEELAGFALAIRDHSQAMPTPAAPVVDCAGAYDGRVRTIPVGAAAALVAATAGVSSLFHGIAGLGRSGLSPGEILTGLLPNRTGSASVRYVDQNDYCPALAALKPLRNELGLRTAFNTAEKLVGLALEGAGVRSLVVGVFHGAYLEKVARTAALLGIRRALIIQGLEGSDDLPVTRDSRVWELQDGEMRSWAVELSSLGIQRFPAAAMEGQGLSFALRALRNALAGDGSAIQESVLLNTGMRLYLADKTPTLADGVQMARELMG